MAILVALLAHTCILKYATKTGNNFNPQLFGLGIADNIAPVIEKLFIYDRRYSTSESVVKQVALKASGNSYTTQPPIVKPVHRC